MKKKWKIALAVAFVLIAAVAVTAGIKYNQRGIVTVQTGKVARQDLTSLVTASGEIKPRNYINLGANTMGPARITQILVVEGDRVKKGEVVARLESVQAEAEVAAQRAAVGSSEADSSANEASLRAADQAIITAQASLERAKADLDRARIDFQRTEKLWNEKLVARQEYDTRQSALAAAEAGLKEGESRIDQEKARRQQIAAQLNAQQRRVSQVQANLRRASDVLDKYNVYSPIDGVVTNLPVRVGETVVPGIQNSPASTVMTVADMSLITAEVKVDETDIVNVKLGQTADVSIDAIPNRTFRGRVIEIGNTAILRSTGLAASQSAVSSQEAKDFKVVVALNDPPEDIRPGLSCTAKVTTATRNRVLSIPIQALTVRQKGDLEAPVKDEKGKAAAAPVDPVLEKARKEELQGVFVVSGEKAEFRKVETGITGMTDIEVTSGLNEGDQIITGSYKVIRTLRNDTKIKVDNQAPVKAES
ncbi:MAG TPA: efflux RND transporter periplasmic adaptor subunit [Bryobacteraceae bacterium]|nr:efflux RND transporter periplasmic adaptor subunit [Bryobacteraceae bacterium]